MRIHYLIHVKEELPGAIANWATNHQLTQSYTYFYENSHLPEIEEIDMLVVMGGPMNIYEFDKFPWLSIERTFIKKAIDAGKKVLGVCLGAQIIADVLGAKVVRNEHVEIGWFPVELVSQKNTSTLIEGIDLNTVLHWHGDRFQIPEDATHLLKSEACNQQAFIYSDHVLAFQFHIEMTHENLEKMIDLDRTSLVKQKWVMTEQELRDGAKFIVENNKSLFSILNKFAF